jgi:hypothetical protein
MISLRREEAVKRSPELGVKYRKVVLQIKENQVKAKRLDIDFGFHR